MTHVASTSNVGVVSRWPIARKNEDGGRDDRGQHLGPAATAQFAGEQGDDQHHHGDLDRRQHPQAEQRVAEHLT